MRVGTLLWIGLEALRVAAVKAKGLGDKMIKEWCKKNNKLKINKT